MIYRVEVIFPIIVLLTVKFTKSPDVTGYIRTINGIADEPFKIFADSP